MSGWSHMQHSRELLHWARAPWRSRNVFGAKGGRRRGLSGGHDFLFLIGHTKFRSNTQCKNACTNQCSNMIVPLMYLIRNLGLGRVRPALLANSGFSSTRHILHQFFFGCLQPFMEQADLHVKVPGRLAPRRSFNPNSFRKNFQQWVLQHPLGSSPCSFPGLPLRLYPSHELPVVRFNLIDVGEGLLRCFPMLSLYNIRAKQSC